MKKASIILLILILFSLNIGSQNSKGKEKEKEDQSIDITEPIDFSIPSSPAFLLLDVNPSKVNRPGFIKDFNFDWIIKDNQLSPNISLDFKPVWMLFFGNVSFEKYQKMHWILRTLSTLSFSIGTVEKGDVRSLAYSLKLTLYREKDPIKDTIHIDKIKPEYETLEKEIILKKNEKEYQIGKSENLSAEEKKKIKKEIKVLDAKLKIIEKMQKEKISNQKREYKKNNWNTAIVDVGIGKIYEYAGESLDKLDFTNQGTGIWINGCFGIKKRFLISGLFKYINFSNEKQYSGGINIRYGSPNLNFFLEGFYENLKEEDKITIAYGGDFRINPSMLVEFGVRSEYDKDFKFSNLIPIINLKWIMKKN